MRKHLALLGISLLVAGIQSAAYGADTTRPAQKDTTQSQTQQNQSNPTMSPSDTPADTQATPSERPASAASDKSNRPQNAKDDEAYQAKLKKCNAMSDATAQKSCMDKAKKEHGQM